MSLSLQPFLHSHCLPCLHIFRRKSVWAIKEILFSVVKEKKKQKLNQTKARISAWCVFTSLRCPEAGETRQLGKGKSGDKCAARGWRICTPAENTSEYPRWQRFTGTYCRLFSPCELFLQLSLLSLKIHAEWEEKRGALPLFAIWIKTDRGQIVRWWRWAHIRMNGFHKLSSWRPRCSSWHSWSHTPLIKNCFHFLLPFISLTETFENK